MPRRVRKRRFEREGVQRVILLKPNQHGRLQGCREKGEKALFSFLLLHSIDERRMGNESKGKARQI